MKIIKSIILSLSLVATSYASAMSSGRNASHYVYVESNIASSGANSIVAYQSSSEGTLETLPGSPFLTGGAGVFDSSFGLGPFDSDQNIITNPEHTFLFAVNSGSNSIAVFHIGSDGGLTAVEGSPFPSYGVDPVSLGYQDGDLVVVNKHDDPAQASDQSLPNYTTFHVGTQGQLTPIDGSTVEVANGSSPSQALIDHNLVFGADFLGGLLQSFEIHSGYLKQNEPLALPAEAFQGISAPRLPLGLTINPSAPVLYVGLPTASKIGVYTFNRSGDLKFLSTAPNSGQAVCWLRSNRSGNRLYTSNSGDHSISVYDTTNPYSPTEIQKTVLTTQGNLFQIALDPSDSFVYAIEQRSAASIPQTEGNAIHVLKIDSSSGQLTELPNQTKSLSVPNDTRIQGIAIF
jgi:6-phosphogluconolactonase (cycloisomerase 2 family)